MATTHPDRSERPDGPDELRPVEGADGAVVDAPDAPDGAAPVDPSEPGVPAGRWRRHGWFAALREVVDRPLTPYYLLLGASGLLLTIGLVMVLSASSVWSYKTLGGSYDIVLRQLVWVAVGVPCALVASRLGERWIRRLAWPAYAFSLVLLLLTVFLGRQTNGNQNWLGVGQLSIQPSEVAKLALVLWAAHVYSLKDRKLSSLHHVLVPVVPGFVLATGLVLAGGDLGTAVVFFALLLGLLWVVGAPGKLFGLAVSMIGVGVLFLISTSPERLGRLTNFVDPFQDFHDRGWQPAHGLYALSSGGIFGQGIGASQQKWEDLPEAHTDYIFAVLGEELGLVGTLLVLGLFFTIAYAAIRVARQTVNPFVRYVCFGVTVWLCGQTIINVGMVLSLLPVIGIPLPLISYGGSALVPSLVALGLLIGFARRLPEEEASATPGPAPGLTRSAAAGR